MTGGAGFIGANIVRLAKEKNYSVRVLDNLSTGSKRNIRDLDVDFVNGEVTDPKLAFEATKGVRYVFHQAAVSASPQFAPDPTEGLRVNIVGFSNVLTAAAKNHVEKFVYAMTSSMYGNSPVPWTEDSLLASSVPNVYASSLLTRAYVAKQVEADTGLKTVGLVYFSVYGRYEAAKKNYANIVSQFLWSIKSGQSPILYGDGSQTRDFVNALDVARANLAAAESDYSGGYVNVGTGKEVSMKEVVTKLEKILGKEVNPVYRPNPIYGYCYRTRADTRKATKMIGFSAKVGFEDGLHDLADFYKGETLVD